MSPTHSRSLPQAPPDIDDALALSCTLPPAGRDERRIAVQEAIAQATSASELDLGVAFAFDHTDDVARRLLELVLAERTCCAEFVYTIVITPRENRIALRIEGTGRHVQPVKQLYLGLARRPASMSRSQPEGRRLPVVGTNAARVIGGAGALACVLCCVSIPAVVAAISALGLGFLRNDRLLFPAEIVSLVVLAFVFVRSRARHHRNAPWIVGLTAAALMLVGLRTRAPLGTIAALAGALGVIAVVFWDWQLQC